MRHVARWPLLLAAAVLTATAVGVDLGSEGGRGVAALLLTLGAVCLGAFTYGEGARHREWSEHERQARDVLEHDGSGDGGHGSPQGDQVDPDVHLGGGHGGVAE